MFMLWAYISPLLFGGTVLIDIPFLEYLVQKSIVFLSSEKFKWLFIVRLYLVRRFYWYYLSEKIETWKKFQIQNFLLYKILLLDVYKLFAF